MYSIYDYYGMQNDLENRYNAGKDSGTGKVTGLANNAPFLSSAQPSQQSSSVTNSTPERASIYDYGTEGSNVYGGEPGVQPGGAEAPAWVSPLINGITTTGLSMVNPVLGAAYGFGLNMAKDAENDNLSWSGTARNAGNAALGLVNPAGQFNRATGITGLPSIGMGLLDKAGYGINTLTQKAWNGFLSLILGNPSSSECNRGSSHNTIGNPLQDPAMFRGGQGIAGGNPFPASYANEYAYGGRLGRGGPNEGYNGMPGGVNPFAEPTMPNTIGNPEEDPAIAVNGNETGGSDFGGWGRGEADSDYGF